ncbi:hypothetical protein Tco_0564118, partial [Tanacetum coccineum]
MFQVVIDIIKNSTCFNAFTISADVPKIFMQQFWYTIKKAPDTDSYEFLLANKKCTVNAEVFRTILDICPRIEDVPDDDTALTFLIDLGYNGPLNSHTNMFVDHMHQPWRTLAAIINKCLSGKLANDGIVSRLKFVRIDEDYQEYGLPIPDVMLTDAIKCSESYQMFIKYSTNQIPPKKSRGKDKKKTTSRRVVKKKVTLSADDNIITDGTRGSNEGTGTIPGVPNESTVVSATSSKGIGAKPGVPDEDKDITKEKDDKDGDADEEGDDHVSDTKHADDEDVETKSDEDDIYKYKIRVRKDEDVEMKDADVEGSDKDDEEITDAAKEEAEKTSESKDDTKKTELPPSSSSLSVSLETTNLPPIPEIITETPVTTVVPSPLVTPIIPSVQQTPTPIPTPTITIDALTVTTAIQESNALSAVEIRVAKLEKDLYHALIEALIEDENVMDKEVADTVKDHKRKLNDDEDDDDEDPPAGPNQGKTTKRRRTKESESSKKPSFTKDTTKGKTPTKGSKTGKSAPAKEPVEEPIAEVIMDDAGDYVAHDDNPPQDTSEPKTRKTLNPEWFKQPSRPPTLDPKWNKRQVVLDQPTQPWFNQMVSASKDPLTFNDLMATPIDFSKYMLNEIKIENFTQDILLGPAFNLLKEGDRYPFDLSKPLPLQGPSCHRTVVADYFFNNDLEYLKTSDPEVTYATSITKTKAARYEIKIIEDMVPILWSTIKHAYDKDALMRIKHWGERRKLWYRSQVNKFSKKNAYSSEAILGVKSLSVKKLHGYGYLEEIMVKRS